MALSPPAGCAIRSPGSGAGRCEWLAGWLHVAADSISWPSPKTGPGTWRFSSFGPGELNVEEHPSESPRHNSGNLATQVRSSLSFRNSFAAFGSRHQFLMASFPPGPQSTIDDGTSQRVSNLDKQLDATFCRRRPTTTQFTSPPSHPTQHRAIPSVPEIACFFNSYRYTTRTQGDYLCPLSQAHSRADDAMLSPWLAVAILQPCTSGHGTGGKINQALVHQAEVSPEP
jgi:hypothetical protein